MLALNARLCDNFVQGNSVNMPEAALFEASVICYTWALACADIVIHTDLHTQAMHANYMLDITSRDAAHAKCGKDAVHGSTHVCKQNQHALSL
jgi:hypothetical protein